MAFQGSLRELPLPDIIQLVAVSRKTGTFHIEEEGFRGKIVLRDGQMVHAEAGDLRGEEAVYELSVWPEGRFHFETDGAAATADATIHRENASLLMEAARRVDEWRILSRKVSSTRLVPLLGPGVGLPAALHPDERRVLDAIDGQSTIEAIALQLGESPFEIAKILYGLVTSGTVALREEAPWLAPSELSRLSLEQAAALASDVLDEALARLRAPDARQEIDTLHDTVRQSVDAAGTVKALTRLVRSGRQLVSSEAGPAKATEFFSRVEELFQEG